MSEETMPLGKMKAYFQDFVEKREWKDFHNPKNLSMALSVEAAELMEIFQWLTNEQAAQIDRNPEALQAAKEEVADILFYLIRIADVLKIDLTEAFWEKSKKNEEKYPIEKSKKLAIAMKNF